VGPGYVRVTFKVWDALYHEAAAAASWLGVSFSQLVREAVEEALRAGVLPPRCWCSSGGCGGLVVACAIVGEDLARRAGEAASRAGVSRGELIRRALCAHLERLSEVRARRRPQERYVVVYVG